jgi:hypothetical protein
VHGNATLGSLVFAMTLPACHFKLVAGLLAAALLLPETAFAFRCGNKLVKDGMHEVEVIAICGEPTSKRRLGYAIRSLDVRAHRPSVPGWTIIRSPGHYSYPVEVMVTEYVYNLGPRKLMRRLVFEAGLLVSVETLGRGYHE